MESCPASDAWQCLLQLQQCSWEQAMVHPLMYRVILLLHIMVDQLLSVARSSL